MAPVPGALRENEGKTTPARVHEPSSLGCLLLAAAVWVPGAGCWSLRARHPPPVRRRSPSFACSLNHRHTHTCTLVLFFLSLSFSVLRLLPSPPLGLWKFPLHRRQAGVCRLDGMFLFSCGFPVANSLFPFLFSVITISLFLSSPSPSPPQVVSYLRISACLLSLYVV